MSDILCKDCGWRTSFIAADEANVFLADVECGECGGENLMFAPETKGAFNKRMVDVVTQPHNCDTPETTSDSGVKSDEPQNPDINHVSATDGDLGTE